MRVLILEPNLAGHHAPYLHHLLQGLADLGQEGIVTTCPQASESPEFKIHLASVAAAATWDESVVIDHATTRAYAQGMLRGLQESIRRHRPDHVWVPFADLLTELLGVRALAGRRVRWPSDVETEGLFFRGRFAHPAEHWTKLPTRAIAKLTVPFSNWNLLHFLDPIAFEMLKKSSPRIAGRVRLMPDPVESVTQVDRVDARRQLKLPEDGRLAGCVGMLTPRKRVDLLLAAFRKADLSPTDRLLLAGPIHEEVSTHIEREYHDLVQQDRILIIDRHLAVDEVMLGVMASDVVCVPNPFQMGSSSFVIRAAAARRPALTSDFGWMGWTVPRFELGWTTDVRDVGGYAAALRHAIEHADGASRSEVAEQFVRYHSPENFQAHWTARLRERLELPPDERLVTWEEVLATS